MDLKHLNLEALLRAAYGAAGSEEARHAASCETCAAAVAGLEARRSAASASAVDELPEAFWQRQRHTILAAVEWPVALRFRRFALAVSLLVLLAAAVETGGRPKPQLPFERVEDEQLLRDVNLIVTRIEPRALAPAALLIPNETEEVRQP